MHAADFILTVEPFSKSAKYAKKPSIWLLKIRIQQKAPRTESQSNELLECIELVSCT